VLENLDKLLPIIERLDDEGTIADLFGLPAIIGVFCFLPGLIIGILVPKKISLGLVGVIIVVATIAILLLLRSDKVYRKKYIKYASERGVPSTDAEDFFAFWKGLNSKARKRLTNDMKRKVNAKNN